MINKRFLIPAAAALLLFAVGCPESDLLDDADSAPVSLEVEILNNSKVTTQDVGGACGFIVEEWKANARNVPKTENAKTRPFNDIELQDVTIEYRCDPNGISPCPGVTSPRIFPTTGTVPADGAIEFAFTPLFLDDVNLALAGTTLILDMTFTATTISGEAITFRTGDTLSVDGCP